LTGKAADCDGTLSGMIAIWLIIIIGLYALAVLHLAVRYREFRNVLAGPFFVSSGVLGYLRLSNTSMPMIGTRFVETPATGGFGGGSAAGSVLF
jgi:hypothetical protein